jgi:hypothetical protein
MQRLWLRCVTGWMAFLWRWSWQRLACAAMTVEELEKRLSDRFRVLTGGSRTALPRQQTLRATIDWSYDLLQASQKSC